MESAILKPTCVSSWAAGNENEMHQNELATSDEDHGQDFDLCPCHPGPCKSCHASLEICFYVGAMESETLKGWNDVGVAENASEILTCPKLAIEMLREMASSSRPAVNPDDHLEHKYL